MRRSRAFALLVALSFAGSTFPAADPRPPALADAAGAARLAAEIDRLILERLAAAGRQPAAPADDAEFLRRACLDLTGRIPTAERTRAFLECTDPDKRPKLIDELLARPEEYGQHFARLWARLIAAEEPVQRPPLEKWLAERFNAGRGWDETVRGLLTATGKGPETAFVLSHVENKMPDPPKLAGATARLFLGVQLQCAECHKHPFADWQQADFWGVAAFFSRTRVQAKGDPVGVAEVAAPPGKGKPKVTGAALVLPNTAGKGSGQVVKAKLLQGAEPDLGEVGPYRPALAAWVTGENNPFFARAAVNRLWGHLFGRGLVNPVDDLHEGNPPTHPAVLEALAAEFARSGHDLKHLTRVLCATQAYQRTSKGGPPAPAEDPVLDLYGRMAVKVMSPDALYDSLTLALGVKDVKVTAAAGYGSGRGGAKAAAKAPPREQFVKLFGTQEPDSTPVDYTHGIPQALSLLNEPQFNHGAPVLDALLKKDAAPEKVIEGLFLATLSRRPTAEELKRLGAYVARQSEARKGYAGVLWVLVNSQEFVLVP